MNLLDSDALDALRNRYYAVLKRATRPSELPEADRLLEAVNNNLQYLAGFRDALAGAYNDRVQELIAEGNYRKQ